jgi:hypothetical protein
MVGVLRPSRCELQMSGLAVVQCETGIDRTSSSSYHRVECSRERVLVSKRDGAHRSE